MDKTLRPLYVYNIHGLTHNNEHRTRDSKGFFLKNWGRKEK